MKTRLLLLVPLLSAGSMLCGADPVQPKAEVAPSPAPAALPPPHVAIPAEISRYYQDVNFAACFSTPDERTLVSHIVETSETDKLSSRLQTLTQVVRRITAATTSIDPQMVHDRRLADSAGRPLGIKDEELTEIVSVQRMGNRIQVGVWTRTVTPKTRSFLVAGYDKEAKQPDSEEYSASVAEVLKQAPHRETHTWHFRHGRWVRDEAAVVPLKTTTP